VGLGAALKARAPAVPEPAPAALVGCIPSGAARVVIYINNVSFGSEIALSNLIEG